MRDDEKMTVKPGQEAEYETYVSKNQDGYGNGVIVATAAVGARLDAGDAPEVAEKACHGFGITGFMAGCMAQAVARFHPRGDEFRRWWNKDNQIKDEGDRANESGGVLNPALLSVGEKS